MRLSQVISAKLTALLIIISSFQTLEVNPMIIKTVAGVQTAGYSGDSGPAKLSKLSSPQDVWLDTSRNLFIADKSNNRVRKTTLDGQIATFAGSTLTTYSGDGGPATAAGIGATLGICGDTAGNVCVSDAGRRIRMVNEAGTIETFAGTGSETTEDGEKGDGGPATSAAFQTPYACGFDVSGNYYLVTGNDFRVRRVSAGDHIISTVFGIGSGSFSTGDGGPATAASYMNSVSIFVDSVGKLYLGEFFGNRVRQVNLASGIVTTFAGTGANELSGDGGLATSAGLPGNNIIVAGDVYGNTFIAASNRLHRVDADTNVIKVIAGSGTAGYSGDGLADSAATAAQFSGIQQMTTLDGNVWMPESGNHDVRLVLFNPYPSAAPTTVPTLVPTAVPSAATVSPTETPTLLPSSSTPSITAPTNTPTAASTTDIPSSAPVVAPMERPSEAPSVEPSVEPSLVPTIPPSSTTPSEYPTLAPTVSPTLFPTLRFVGIVFDSTLDLHNVTATELDASAQRAVYVALSMTLNVSVDRVAFLAQSFVGTEVNGNYEVQVTVRTEVSTRDVDGVANDDAVGLFDTLSATLSGAVNSTDFSQAVRTASANMNATHTLFVGDVTLVATKYTDAGAQSGDSGGSDVLTTGEFAAIVVGVLVAALLCSWCLFCLVSSHPRRSSQGGGDEEMQPSEGGSETLSPSRIGPFGPFSSIPSSPFGNAAASVSAKSRGSPLRHFPLSPFRQWSDPRNPYQQCRYCDGRGCQRCAGVSEATGVEFKQVFVVDSADV